MCAATVTLWQPDCSSVIWLGNAIGANQHTGTQAQDALAVGNRPLERPIVPVAVEHCMLPLTGNVELDAVLPTTASAQVRAWLQLKCCALATWRRAAQYVFAWPRVRHWLSAQLHPSGACSDCQPEALSAQAAVL